MKNRQPLKVVSHSLANLSPTYRQPVANLASVKRYLSAQNDRKIKDKQVNYLPIAYRLANLANLNTYIVNTGFLG